MTAVGGKGLCADRCFLLLWFAQSASIAGGQIRTVVLPVLRFQLTQSPSLTAMLVTVQAAPYLLFGLIAGAVSDRVNRRTVMVSSDIVSAGAMGAVPAAAAFEICTPAVLFGAAAVTGTAFVWHDSALFGSLPTIVGRNERVVAAYSALISTQQVLQLVATAGAGVLIATTGAAEALWIDSGCYLASAAAVLVIPRRLKAQRVSDPRPSLRSDIGEGLRYVRGHRIIWPLTASGFGSALGGF
ncbi:MAG: MFS transporter [Rhodococcus sp. (in: high G+C Gram-positive bacteria)]|uniref:MFS transporter n=1 Tax=Rhodococcus sp. TaxID=1831 RepID=UPI002AD9999E|nr:MFS transporter [Rhodococcus sp. (in: high G+C Gram-positive bacteria)]